MELANSMIIEKTPLLVFGGPYSNIQATQALRAEAVRRNIPLSNIICTGDVVAYAAAPEETTDLIRQWGIQVVAGNCEEQLAGGAQDCGCGFEEGSACDRLSRGWYPFALSQTSAVSRSWMGSLPTRHCFSYAGAQWCALHGGATVNNRFLFASDRGQLQAEFDIVRAETGCDIVLAGHAGLPFVAQLDGGWWINAGVIGMPANDGTPDGWFAIIDGYNSGVRVALRRLAYDHVAAAAELRRAGHANGYARTMITGIWPSHDVLPSLEQAATGQPIAEEEQVLGCYEDLRKVG
jgi:predicted phosphodiesterase